MSGLEVLLAVAGFVVTALVIAGMILLTPRGQVDVLPDEDHAANGNLSPATTAERVRPTRVSAR
jgi:hypothetical protein